MPPSRHRSTDGHRTLRRLTQGGRAAVVLGIAVVGALSNAGAWATPIVPAADDEVVEVLPAIGGNRGEERRLRRAAAARPTDPVIAVDLARRYLAQAHELGDPRYAGMALAALQAWTDVATMPAEVLLVRADLQQYLHEFDAAVASLQALLARRGEERRAQAWLTLATVRRVQGRYDESDAACRSVAASGASLHGQACLAENAALRGDTARSRATLDLLISQPGLDAGSQAWLTTTLAELEQRAGRYAEADAAFRASLALRRDAYAVLAYADFLIDSQRPGEAWQLLQTEPRTDAVLLRLAIAGKRAAKPSAAADATEMRERIQLANQRPDAKFFHGREQAMFALDIEQDAARALELARGNVAHQREALDLLVLARAARAAGDRVALDDTRALIKGMNLHDRRIDALL